MIRKAGIEDAGAIAAFLEGHIESSMFLLGNLQAHGIGNTEHHHGTSYYLRETGEGITGVFGVTNGGFLLCQLPNLTATEAQTYAHLLKGYTMQAITGDAAQVAEIISALPLTEDDWRLNEVEPLYRRELAGLSGVGDVRVAEAGDVPLLTEWFQAYLQETNTAAAGPVDAQAAQRAKAAVDSPNLVLLVEDGAPVAMAGINARVGTAVQVGGVFVPKPLRGAGRGGAVTAGLLAGEKAAGTTTAILFAASEAAAKTYERIGFEHCGGYRVALLKTPVTLANPT